MVILRVFNEGMLWYFVALNTATLALVSIAAFHIIRRARRAQFAGCDDIFANPLTPPISIVAPAHNEAAVIHESVQAMERGLEKRFTTEKRQELLGARLAAQRPESFATATGKNEDKKRC